ncbi:uncharacterized protein LOC131078889 [Cryptomeria japonica]|uniref:uncharacterized protein LOC131078889 n=1 Tax=Cryptomeria japonica TaxID=3369 RepID=UPI0027DA1CBE|nr:uncharacterized protein LOC131078889 [Cryptomeria japonica]XP_059072843.1 uncharacterized protein LOC131078889 [Cryptomeria japonica]
MAMGETGSLSMTIATLSILAFCFGIVAENKKPASGTPIPGKGIVICKYPSDPTILLGSLSIILSFLTSVSGVVAIIYPYKGKSVPAHALKTTNLMVFFVIATVVSFVSQALMTWTIITESLHRSQNVHHDLTTLCPTAKTGLYGGAAFLALDAGLFWLICQMLALNARSDYEYDDEEDIKGQYGQVTATDYNPIQPGV